MVRRAWAGTWVMTLLYCSLLVAAPAAAVGAGVPRDLIVTTDGLPSGTVRLSWGAPENRVSGYALAWASLTAASGQRQVSAETTTATLTGLSIGATYQISVAAVLRDGSVGRAATVTATLSGVAHPFPASAYFTANGRVQRVPLGAGPPTIVAPGSIFVVDAGVVYVASGGGVDRIDNAGSITIYRDPTIRVERLFLDDAGGLYVAGIEDPATRRRVLDHVAPGGQVTRLDAGPATGYAVGRDQVVHVADTGPSQTTVTLYQVTAGRRTNARTVTVGDGYRGMLAGRDGVLYLQGHSATMRPSPPSWWYVRSAARAGADIIRSERVATLGADGFFYWIETTGDTTSRSRLSDGGVRDTPDREIRRYRPGGRSSAIPVRGLLPPQQGASLAVGPDGTIVTLTLEPRPRLVKYSPEGGVPTPLLDLVDVLPQGLQVG